MVFQGREKHVQSLKVPGRKGQMDFLGRSNEERINPEAEGKTRRNRHLCRVPQRPEKDLENRILRVKTHNFLLAYSRVLI